MSYGLCSVKDGIALTNAYREKLIPGKGQELSFRDVQWAVVYISMDFRGGVWAGDKHLGVVRI